MNYLIYWLLFFSASLYDHDYIYQENRLVDVQLRLKIVVFFLSFKETVNVTSGQILSSLNIISVIWSSAAAKFLMNKHAINADVTRKWERKQENGQVSGRLSTFFSGETHREKAAAQKVTAYQSKEKRIALANDRW